MPDNAAQEEIIQTLLLVALSLCFEAGEEYLTEDQILTRGFSPTIPYGKACLKKLIDSNAVECLQVDTHNPLNRKFGLAYLKNPVDEKANHRTYIMQCSVSLFNFLELAPGNELHFLSLHIDIKAQECLEYAQFYAKKSNINIVGSRANNTKLTLMLMELKLENVFALIWRSVKILERLEAAKKKTTNYSDVINLAFEKYTDTKNSAVQFDEYKRPRQIKQSKISWVASKLLTEIPKIGKTPKS